MNDLTVDIVALRMTTAQKNGQRANPTSRRAICREENDGVKRRAVCSLPSHPSARRRVPFYVAALAALMAFATLVTSPTADAQRQHRVRSGQTLARIARRYRVSVSNLAGANQLRSTARLREGQILTIPEEGVVYVAVGQTLSQIARENNVSMRDLARANRMSQNATLRPGQRLILPGQEHLARARERYGRPRNPGVVDLFRVANRERLRIRILDSRGRPRRAARNRLRQFMRERRTDASHDIDGRLLRLLVLVSDHFGGRRINIISGFRAAGGFTRESSRHTQGKAIDFRIDRVDNRELRDYCRDLGNVGVGYYPNSRFVHLDTRRSPAYWVDYSRPGEAPRYRRRGGGGGGSGGENAGSESGESAAASD